MTVMLCLALFGTVLPTGAATVTVFAAASLTESLREIGAAYEKESGDRIVFNFAASGPLARQVSAGAPADLFISADEASMDSLQAKGLIVEGTRRDRLSNVLVIVTAAEEGVAIRSPADLASPVVKRLALGEVKTVPAGAYAREYLLKQGLWSGVERKVIPCENVRAVLAAVEAGNVDAGIVYRTDAAISRKVKVAFEISRQEGPEIRYPFALLQDAPQPQAARRFLDHLAAPVADAVFKRRGFIVLPAEPARE